MKYMIEIWNKYSSKIFLAIFIFLVFFICSIVLDVILKKISKRVDTKKSEIYGLIASSQKTILIIIGLISSLGTIGVNVSALVAGLGLTGFAVGLALKDAISNLVAGVMIILYKPFEIGDIIELAGSQGEVTNINLRYITLVKERSNYLIPNSLFLSNKIGVINPNKQGDKAE